MNKSLRAFAFVVASRFCEILGNKILRSGSDPTYTGDNKQLEPLLLLLIVAVTAAAEVVEVSPGPLLLPPVAGVAVVDALAAAAAAAAADDAGVVMVANAPNPMNSPASPLLSRVFRLLSFPMVVCTSLFVLLVYAD